MSMMDIEKANQFVITRKLLEDLLDIAVPCNTQDSDMHEDECPKGYEFECGRCEIVHAAQELLLVSKPTLPPMDGKGVELPICAGCNEEFHPDNGNYYDRGGKRYCCRGCAGEEPEQQVAKLRVALQQAIELLESEPNHCLQVAPEMGKNNYNEETVREWENKRDAWVKQHRAKK